MKHYGEAFFRVGHLYRLKQWDPSPIVVLFYAKWTTRAQHWDRTIPDFSDDGGDRYGDAGYDWGWDISLLLPEPDELHMFFRHHLLISESLEKIGSKQPLEVV